MPYRNPVKGTRCDHVQLCDIRLQNRHGKKSLVAIWRYSRHAKARFHESPIRFFRGQLLFSSGS